MRRKINLEKYVDVVGGSLDKIGMNDVLSQIHNRGSPEVILVVEKGKKGRYQATVYIPEKYFTNPQRPK